jgi:hypothetical protein
MNAMEQRGGQKRRQLYRDAHSTSDKAGAGREGICALDTATFPLIASRNRVTADVGTMPFCAAVADRRCHRIGETRQA